MSGALGGRLERLGLALAVAAAIVWIAIVAAGLPRRATRWDFGPYYASALVLREGGNPYTTDLRPVGARVGVEIRDNDRGTYTPTFLTCFAPLTLMSARRAYWTWFAINFACFIAAIALLFRDASSALGVRARVWLVIGIIFYTPIQVHLNLGQNQFLILFALVLAIRWLEAGRDASAGLVLAAAALLRAYPLALGGYLLVRRRWAALSWMIGAVVAGALLTIAVAGWETCYSFRIAINFMTGRHFLDQAGNVALASIISRAFWYFGPANPGGGFEFARAATSLAARLALVGVTALVTLAPSAGRPDRDRRAYSLWIATMILLSPTAWMHYLVLLILPFIALASARSVGRASGRAVAMCIASYALTDLAFVMAAAIGQSEVWGAIGQVGGFVALALAWLALLQFVHDGAGIGPESLAAERPAMAVAR
jgi:Glycosyltransferase family 87